MKALPTRTVRPVRHLLLPFEEVGRIEPLPGETIQALLLRTGWGTRVRDGRRMRWAFRLPTICVVDGQPVRQREWKRRRIKPGNEVAFWSRPHGKRTSGKQVVGLVALIALAAFAPAIGGVLAGAVGLAGVTGAASIISGAVLLGGSLLVSALTSPKAGGQNALDSSGDQIEQLYKLEASGNAARLFQPIACQYGRLKTYPDYATAPWSEFEGSEQFLNVLLATGHGTFDYEQVLMDDTTVWDSSTGVQSGFEAQLAFYNPGETVTLFPTNVVTSGDVNGQELTTTSLGPFVVSAPATPTTKIALDFTFPAGLFKVPDNADTSAAMDSVSVTVVAEYQEVNDAGVAIGSWTNLFTRSFRNATKKPFRATVATEIGAGRFQVRARRTNDANDPWAPGGWTGSSGVVTDNISWAGLRGFIANAVTSYPVSTVAIRIRATRLTGNSAKKFGVIGTRRLHVWNGSGFVEQATRNPFWAAWDAATNTSYGLKRPMAKVDFATLYALALDADARGDSFDYRFDAAMPAPEAMDTILRGSRSRHRWSGDVMTFVRDEWSAMPRMLLTDREIVRGTLSVEYVLNPDDAADSVLLEYVDEDIWAFAEVQYPPNSETFQSENPSRLRIPGVVNREHAFREAAFYYLQAQFRRINVALDTEHDGRMLGFGSRVRVQSELPLSWGYSGAVIGVNENTITLDPAPVWDEFASHYIAIRTKTGRQFGPVLCSRGVLGDAFAVLDPTDLATVEAAQSTTLAAALKRAPGADEPSFDFGPGDSRARDCLVMTGRPSRDRVTLGLVVDNVAVHQALTDSTPVLPSLPALRDPKVPEVIGLNANWQSGVAETSINASWWPAAGAVFYVGQISYDGGANWTPVYEGVDPSFSVVADPGAVKVRVSGYGENLQGAWALYDVAAPTVEISRNVVSSASLADGLRDYVTVQLKQVTDELSMVQQRIASVASEQDASQFKADLYSRDLAQASVGGIYAAVSVNAAAVATIDGKLAATYTIKLDANGYWSGLQAYNDGSSAGIILRADYFQIAQPGTGGGAIPVFEVAMVDGSAKLVMRGDMFADGIITGQQIAADTITGGKIIADEITTQHLRADAATAVWYASAANTTVTNGNEATLIQVDITVVVGKVDIIVSAEPSTIVASAVTAPNAITYKIYDGATLLKSASSSPVTLVSTASFIAFTLTFTSNFGYINTTMFSVVTLSAGTHTIYFKVNNTSGYNLTFLNPSIRVLESRR